MPSSIPSAPSGLCRLSPPRRAAGYLTAPALVGVAVRPRGAPAPAADLDIAVTRNVLAVFAADGAGMLPRGVGHRDLDLHRDLDAFHADVREMLPQHVRAALKADLVVGDDACCCLQVFHLSFSERCFRTPRGQSFAPALNSLNAFVNCFSMSWLLSFEPHLRLSSLTKGT